MTVYKAIGILGLSLSDSLVSIKKKYHSLIKENHPDKVEQSNLSAVKAATEKSKEINDAYSTITDIFTSEGYKTIADSPYAEAIIFAQQNDSICNDQECTNNSNENASSPARDTLKWDWRHESFDNFYSKADYEARRTYYRNFSSDDHSFFESCLKEFRELHRTLWFRYYQFVGTVFFANASKYCETHRGLYIQYTFSISHGRVKRLPHCYVGEVLNATFGLFNSRGYIGSIFLTNSSGEVVDEIPPNRFLSTVLLPQCRCGSLKYIATIVKQVDPAGIKYTIVFKKTGCQFPEDEISSRYYNYRDFIRQRYIDYSYFESYKLLKFFCTTVANSSATTVPVLPNLFGCEILSYHRYLESQPTKGAIDILDANVDENILDNALAACSGFDCFINESKENAENCFFQFVDYYYLGLNDIDLFIKIDRRLIRSRNKYSYHFSILAVKKGWKSYSYSADAFVENLSTKYRFIATNNIRKKQTVSSDRTCRNDFISPTLRRALNSIGINKTSQIIEITPQAVWRKLYEHNSQTPVKYIVELTIAINGGNPLAQNEIERLYDYIDSFRSVKIKRKKKRIEPEPDSLLGSLPNIGPRMLLRLSEIGITHISDLDGKSTEEIWLQLYLNDTNVSYHEIYAIEGAKARVKTSEILQTRKATLAAFVNDSIKGKVL